MEKFDSISHFLETGGFDYCVFEMGRKVIQVPNLQFVQIENQHVLYPYPFQQKAWLALLFWQEDKQDAATIWFLQFPIDEMGYLQQQSRDAFLIDLLQQTGKNIQAKRAGKSALDELGESPFAFKPQAGRLAMFHAFATKILNQKPSKYYQHACDYLTGEAGYEQWQFLGLQGIADVVARLEQDNNFQLLTNAIESMPSLPLQSFSIALEHVKPEGQLTDELIIRLNKELKQKNVDVTLVSALVRSLSGSQPEINRKVVVTTVLESSVSTEIEVLVAISGRAWKDLADNKLLSLFIDKLSNQNQNAFNAVLVDLMMIPGMREAVMQVVRKPGRSSEFNLKLNQFMKAIQS